MKLLKKRLMLKNLTQQKTQKMKLLIRKKLPKVPKVNKILKTKKKRRAIQAINASIAVPHAVRVTAKKQKHWLTASDLMMTCWKKILMMLTAMMTTMMMTRRRQNIILTHSASCFVPANYFIVAPFKMLLKKVRHYWCKLLRKNAATKARLAPPIFHLPVAIAC